MRDAADDRRSVAGDRRRCAEAGRRAQSADALEALEGRRRRIQACDAWELNGEFESESKASSPQSAWSCATPI
jgi:hypothetical protein